MSPPVHYDYDVIILGGGPAGLACALGLGGTGWHVALFEKDSYPRDKICGDALGPDVLNMLKRLPNHVYSSLLQLEGKHPVYGMQLWYPPSHSFSFDFRDRFGNEPAGYILPRKDFDMMLWQCLKVYDNIEVFTGWPVDSADAHPDAFRISVAGKTYTARMGVVATGASSSLTRKFAGWTSLPHTFAFAVRSYFRGLKTEGPGDRLYFYFLKETLPGYFWIFPAGSGTYNVGMGLPVKEIERRKMSLKKEFLALTGQHPVLEPVFRIAVMAAPVMGHPLPYSGFCYPLSGNRCLLAGDAAGVVNPLTGEGVANALRTGLLAAGHIAECLGAGDFCADRNKLYDRMVKQRISRGLSLGKQLQKLASHEKTVNLFFHVAAFFPPLKRWMKGLIHRL
ncbi:MAG: NAD(P)/FAD-dependent oxidoreductase [Bacteroidales bacterium]